MHLQFLSYFVEPGTNQPLSLEIDSGSGDIVESGFLVNKSNLRRYPIIRGIPRFVDYQENNYAKSFGYQWHRWPKVQFESENLGKPMEGHTRGMWERIVSFHDKKLNLVGKTVVDIGCGPGRFVDVARSKGAKVIGIDYSGAVEVAARNFRDDPDVCICQADALRLPLKSNSVDGAFSIGVLHHTPDPKQGVREAHRIVHPEGWFAVSVYPKGGYYDFPSVQMWRKLFNVLWPFLKYYPPLIYTYFTNCVFRPVAVAIPPLGKAIRLFFPFVKLPDFQWSLLDTFDSLTPSHQSAHDTYEVFCWLKEAGFKDIEPSNWGFCSFVGFKDAVTA
ncbi:MAG: methyltransferase domain-containing protein [Desulfomonilaceae bacterium]